MIGRQMWYAEPDQKLSKYLCTVERISPRPVEKASEIRRNKTIVTKRELADVGNAKLVCPLKDLFLLTV